MHRHHDTNLRKDILTPLSRDIGVLVESECVELLFALSQTVEELAPLVDLQYCRKILFDRSKYF